MLGGLTVLEVVKITLAPDGAVSAATVSILIDALWVIAPISVGMQHVSARRRGRYIDVVIFLISDNQDTIARAWFLCEQALRLPFLKDWRLLLIEPIELTPPGVQS